MKLLSILRWISMMLISGIAYGIITFILLFASIWLDINMVFIASTLVFTSWVMFTLLYPFRNTFIRRTKPFWYYFDDEDEFGFNVSWFIKGRKKNFFTAWDWAARRNPWWNAQASLVVKKGDSKTISAKGKLTKNGKRVHDYKMAVIKWVDKNGENVGNKGEYISLIHSIIGTMFLWYKKGGRLYWRFSTVRQIGKWWIEFQIGTTDDAIVKGKLQRGRYTWRFKPYKNPKIYTKLTVVSSMTTAMQELQEYLQRLIDYLPDEALGAKEQATKIKYRIESEFLEKEKQMIIDVFNESRLTHTMIGFKHKNIDEYLRDEIHLRKDL